MNAAPRSVRNNNPYNLRITKDKWLGLMLRAEMSSEQAAEDEFRVFSSPALSFRATAIVIRNPLASDVQDD